MAVFKRLCKDIGENQIQIISVVFELCKSYFYTVQWNK